MSSIVTTKGRVENAKEADAATAEAVEIRKKEKSADQDANGIHKPLLSKNHQPGKETETEKEKAENHLEKIDKDFKNGQEYNTMHIKVPIVYKLILAAFWIAFWVALLQERVWTMNRDWIFPNYETEGCPANFSKFWADYCLALLFELELTVVHQLFFTSMLYYDFFVVKKKFGFLKTT